MASLAQRAQKRIERVRRALYAVRAAKRVAKAVRGGASIRDAWRKEQANLELHREARRRRESASKAVDAMSERHGDILGWRAVIDGATTPDCRTADGKNFSVSRPPLRGYPGTVHMRCRCAPVPPFPNARTLE